MTSKLEINVRSLIVQCEELVTDTTNHWLLKKYIKSLDTMIKELSDGDDSPKDAVIDEYKMRCKALKDKTNYVEAPKLPSKLKLKSSQHDGDQIVNEMNQMQNAKYASAMSRELLGGKDTNALRQRIKGTDGGGDGDMNEALKHHANVQDKIAEDMLVLTRSLKEQTEIANRIIRKDTDIVSKSNHLSDMNHAALNREAAILKDHSRRAWKCWLWIMIGLVMIIFIFMVLFMKLMKKRTS